MDDLSQEFAKELAQATSLDDVEALRVRYLGRKGRLAEIRKGADFGAMSPEEKRSFGQRFGALKLELETRLEAAQGEWQAKAQGAAGIDLSLPGTGRALEPTPDRTIPSGCAEIGSGFSVPSQRRP